MRATGQNFCFFWSGYERAQDIQKQCFYSTSNFSRFVGEKKDHVSNEHAALHCTVYLVQNSTSYMIFSLRGVKKANRPHNVFRSYLPIKSSQKSKATHQHRAPHATLRKDSRYLQHAKPVINAEDFSRRAEMWGRVRQTERQVSRAAPTSHSCALRYLHRLGNFAGGRSTSKKCQLAIELHLSTSERRAECSTRVA